MSDPQPSRVPRVPHPKLRVMNGRARAREVGDLLQFLEGDQQQQQISSTAAQQQAREAPRLRASEAFLARFLEKRLGFVAPEAFVRGRARTVLRALRGGVLYWEDQPLDADRPGWRPMGRWRNPAAFLQYLVKQMEVR